MDKKIISQLADIVGQAQVTTAPEELSCCSYDGSSMEYMPEAVIFPDGKEQISRIMQIASEWNIPVVVRGAGSGMTGGALPVAGGLVMALARMNNIIEIDRLNQLAVVEPGVITGELQSEVKQVGLFYPPDPASLKFCTIGGNVAECAGGPSAVKYGVTRDYIKGLEVVLADGRIIKTGVRTDKGVVGYDLTRLFVGSEGTLGIITKITVKLLPQPQAKSTFLILIDDIKSATSLVSETMSTFSPCTLEYMDKTAIDIVRQKISFSFPADCHALLLIELDGTEMAVKSEGMALLEFLKTKQGVLKIKQAADQAETDMLWQARRSVSPAAFNLKPHKISEDVVVPRNTIPELVSFTQKLAAELDLTIFTFGHAGDGNIHVNIMLNKDDYAELANGTKAKEEIFKKVIALSGTISGEHGIGISKADYLPLEIDANTIATMKMVKRSFDPQNILNPGKIFK